MQRYKDLHDESTVQKSTSIKNSVKQRKIRRLDTQFGALCNKTFVSRLQMRKFKTWL